MTEDIIYNPMDNAAEDERYQLRRKRIEEPFENEYTALPSKSNTFLCPFGNYRLCIIPYKTKENCWNYTKGIIFDKSDEKLFVIYRNYPSFLFQWIEHKNGNEYLLCGEDYQGYVCLNLTEKKKHVYFHKWAFNGDCFCWIEIEEYNKEYDNNIIVHGCGWGDPYEIIEYDFSEPDKLPYKEISCKFEDMGEDDDFDDEEEN